MHDNSNQVLQRTNRGMDELSHRYKHFSKDFDSEMHRALLNYVKKPKDKLVFVLPQGGRDVPHNSDTLSAVHLVESIRVSLKH